MAALIPSLITDSWAVFTASPMVETEATTTCLERLTNSHCLPPSSAGAMIFA